VSTLYTTSVPRPLLVLAAAHCLHATQSATAAAVAAADAAVQSSTALAVAVAVASAVALLLVVSVVAIGAADGSAVPAAGAVDVVHSNTLMITSCEDKRQV
jgi:hypothetical protein